MGEGMSRKRNPETGLQTVRASAEDQRQAGSRVPPTVEKLTPALHQSNWTSTGHIHFSRGNSSARLDPEEPAGKPAGKEADWEEELLFEDCQEGFPEGPPPLAKVPKAEKTWEGIGLDVSPEPREQHRTVFLTKGTQTEDSCSDHEEQRHSQAGRDPRSSVYMLEAAKRSEKALQQGLRELFGLLALLMAAPALFVVELVHFLSKAVFQGLVLDLITAVGEEMLEPFLAALLHSILQPLLVFLLNVLCGVRDLSCPVVDILRGVALQVAVVLKAFRLVEIHHPPPERPHAEQA